MIKLSVVIITYNEEARIGRCIDAVKDIADDIVVIDSLSKDRTEEIAIEKGARVIEQVFLGHIEQKNFAITKAKYPHILSLDADEVLSDELKESILTTKANWNNDGYTLNRKTNYCGKWINYCGWYPDKKLRLWDSRKGKWTGLNPHDRYEMDSKVSIGHLKGDLYHYSYDSIDDHIAQINKFSTIGAKALYEKGKRITFLNLFFSPLARFLKHYFLKLGFLDGFFGLVISLNSAHSVFLKYAKLRTLIKKKK